MNPSVPHSYQIQILTLFLFGKVSRLSGPLQSSAWGDSCCLIVDKIPVHIPCHHGMLQTPTRP